ncbi:MAG: hypothetical protein BRC48_13960 [Cyanobacteria bacterium QS_9_48_30]|nr:MAG: hypothetical protein BRC48_13960 [Cyanobacteria bacterium QS_9_48_30]
MQPRFIRAVVRAVSATAYLNKIEPWWFVLKNGMKRWDELERFRDGVDAAFNNLLTYLRSAIISDF